MVKRDIFVSIVDDVSTLAAEVLPRDLYPFNGREEHLCVLSKGYKHTGR